MTTLRIELLDVLACPEDNSSIELKIIKETDDEIEQGTLTCTLCNRGYLIQDTIPNLYFNENQTIFEKWWELSEAPLVDKDFMRGIDPHKQSIRTRIRNEVVSIGKSVLDVGCATCIDYPLYQEIGFCYVGVDLTFKLLQGARKNTPTVPVVRGDAKKLPFKNESFDSSYIKDVMVHLQPDEYIKVLTEMWRVSRKALMIGFFGDSVDTNKKCEYKLNPINPKVGYSYAHYWSTYTKEAIQNILYNLPNFDKLEIDHVSLEGYENFPEHKRTFYKATKKQN